MPVSVSGVTLKMGLETPDLMVPLTLIHEVPLLIDHWCPSKHASVIPSHVSIAFCKHTYQYLRNSVLILQFVLNL